MQRTAISLPLALIVLVSATSAFTRSAAAETLDPRALERASKLSGSFVSGSRVFRMSVPRSELKVQVAGTRLTPRLGLAAWATFTGTPTKCITIGDIPLLEGEVNPVLQRALDAGLEVTSLHNTFLWDSPRLMSLHFSGTGSQDKLATAVGEIFRGLKTTPRSEPGLRPAAANATKSTLDPAVVSKILFWKGELEDGVYRVSTARGVKLDGEELGGAMGIETWASFAGSNERAVVNGDVAMIESELQRVLHALIAAHIQVLSIHTHLTNENPRLMFVHFWGSGSFVDLARGVRSALEVQKNFRGST